jgi:hypothetical protein
MAKCVEQEITLGFQVVPLQDRGALKIVYSRRDCYNSECRSIFSEEI